MDRRSGRKLPKGDALSYSNMTTLIHLKIEALRAKKAIRPEMAHLYEAGIIALIDLWNDIEEGHDVVKEHHAKKMTVQ